MWTREQRLHQPWFTPDASESDGSETAEICLGEEVPRLLAACAQSKLVIWSSYEGSLIETWPVSLNQLTSAEDGAQDDLRINDQHESVLPFLLAGDRLKVGPARHQTSPAQNHSWSSADCTVGAEMYADC